MNSNNIYLYNNKDNAKKIHNLNSNNANDINKKGSQNLNFAEENKKNNANLNILNLQLYANYANKKRSTPKSEGKAYFSQFLENHQHKTSEQIKQDCIVHINYGKEKIKFGFNLDEKNINSKWLVETMREKIGISEAEKVK